MGRKFDLQTKETSGTPQNRTNKTSISNAGTANNCTNMTDYFTPSTNREADKEASRTMTMKIHNDFSDIFTGICCFEGTLKLQVREGSQPYEVPPRRVAYALQEPL